MALHFLRIDVGQWSVRQLIAPVSQPPRPGYLRIHIFEPSASLFALDGELAVASKCQSPRSRRNDMSVYRRKWWMIGVGTALGVVAGSTLAPAQWQNSPLMRGFTDNWSSGASNVVGQLASNEGIYVDMKDFKIMKGAAKGDPTAQIAKLGARKVADGAIIFRAGDGLYIVDSKPPTSTQ
jgi:hypothetical protein